MNIVVSELSKSYFLNGHEVPVLRNISFEINEGDLITLTGPSGVGKSTLLHILGTLDNPSQGQILFDHQNIFANSQASIAEFRNNNIGFVFQFHHLLPEFTALENVMLPLLVRRKSQIEIQKSAKEWLERVGLKERIDHKPGELSGGEQQRVALARALVGNPRFLLADEPTGNLDDKTGAGIIEIINEINQEQKITCLIITHNQHLAHTGKRQIHLEASKLSFL